jgi:hypothetical protein
MLKHFPESEQRHLAAQLKKLGAQLDQLSTPHAAEATP